jgi:hypothetical protein
VFQNLQKQTLPHNEWEWLPRLSIPREKPDLCYQVNKALFEAKGELIVFLQDWIHVDKFALENIWKLHKQGGDSCYTFPVGQSLNKDGTGDVKWDWRNKPRSEGEYIPWTHWEIDFGTAPKQAILDAGMFDEAFDSGFGWENNDLARRISKLGLLFKVNKDIKAVAWSHDKFEKHPFKGAPNNLLFDSKNTG